MAGIFISYRRDDCAGHAGRLYDRLVDHFGNDEVFMDIDAIAPGVDFGARIEGAIGSCNLLIALIGDDWLDITDSAGRRRLDDPADLVRNEVASALRRTDLRVIPVLVEGAPMPRPEQLPDDLKPLTRLNALELSDGRWRYDVDRLIEVAEGVVPSRSQGQPQQTARADLIGAGTRADRATDRGEGDGAGATPQRNPLGCLLALAIAVVVIGGVATAIVTLTGEGEPGTERLIGDAEKSAGGLTLRVVSVKETKRSTHVAVTASNNTQDTLTLSLFNNCRLRSSTGDTLEADPSRGTWADDLPTGGDLQRGTIVFDGKLPASATRASLSFATIFGSLSGPQNIKVSGIRLRRP